MTTRQALLDAHAEKLDHRWHEPAGKWFLIEKHSGAWSAGHLTRRPTSAGNTTSWSVGDYVGSGFFSVKRHRTFRTFDAFHRALIKHAPEALIAQVRAVGGLSRCRLTNN